MTNNAKDFFATLKSQSSLVKLGLFVRHPPPKMVHSAIQEEDRELMLQSIFLWGETATHHVNPLRTLILQGRLLLEKYFLPPREFVRQCNLNLYPSQTMAV